MTTAAAAGDVDTRINTTLTQMTLEEKAALTVGRDVWTTLSIERLDVPSIWFSDGPTGLRKAREGADMSIGRNVPATCFPTESALGSSWDVELVRSVAAAIAREAQAEGVQVLLGPGVNLKRSPLCGRNFEYFSEDPILTGQLAAAFVTGLQEQGVGASVKHLVANESETDRMMTDSQVDERTLRELYLRPFELTVALAAPWTLMAAYSSLNGAYCAENGRLLHDIVAGEWGYGGIVVSDWLAVNDRVAGVEAGLHLQMPGAPTARTIVRAVQEGRLAEGRLDEIVKTLLSFIFKADAARSPRFPVDLNAHHRLARRAASESVVLLKNEGGLLPLEGEALSDVALLGGFACVPRFQGSGSSQVVPALPVETIYDELIAAAPSARVAYAAGYPEDGALDEMMIREAQDNARRARTAVVVVGLPTSYEEEGTDRTHIDLPPGHNALVEAVLAAQPRTVVVLISGSAVTLPWSDRVPTIVQGWLGGQAGGGAIVDVLTGRVNPSGKLAETFPTRLEDTPAYLSFPDDGLGRVPFTEGLFTGYRWYDARRIAPLFPFGHGLSYTTFTYDDLRVEHPAATGQGDEGDPLTVTLSVRNTGARTGQEVVQLYIKEVKPRLQRPDKELKAFAKVTLEPGEEKEVRFALDRRDFAIYDPSVKAWTVTSTAFELLVGSSSRDIRLQKSVTLANTFITPKLLSRLSPLREWAGRPAVRLRLRPILDALHRRFGDGEDGATDGVEGEDALAPSFVADMPIAKLVMMGALGEDELVALIAAANA